MYVSLILTLYPTGTLTELEPMTVQPFSLGTDISSKSMKTLLNSNATMQDTSRMLKSGKYQQRGADYPCSYWDWTLDWKNITEAPLWDTDLGFGGNGNKSDRVSFNGFCVTDGPFARLEVRYIEDVRYSHCLSRNFASGENLTRFGLAVSPTSVKEVLDVLDYSSFNLGVEHGPHLAIPKSVFGDFSISTAPAGRDDTICFAIFVLTMIQIQCSFYITRN